MQRPPLHHFVPILLSLSAPALAQTPAQAAVQVTAVATTSPPSLTFSWPLDATATGYTVARRLAGATSWGPLTGIPGAGAATTWTDSNVVVGTRYEYWFNKNGNPAARGFLTAGIEASALENRGKLVLLVDATQATALAPRIDRLILDLVGDGWLVLRHDVQPTDPVTAVKALIAADVAANPGQIKSVFVLGHVPVPYSGSIAPDGHPDHTGAWAADVYYGELNGPWTDNLLNTTSASRPENRNIPGDGKFDQSGLPSDMDLQVGRVDLANMPAFGVSETVLLERYLDKDHDYRHQVFAVDQRAVIDDNFGWFGGEAFAASGWRNFGVLVGAGNIVAADYFATLNTGSGNGHVWSYGCGGGSYQSAGGIGATNDFVNATNRSVFTMLFGSYFGDWDVANNFLRAPLCSGWTLTNAWAGRPHWSFHPMVLGETIGYCARYSQNDTTAGGFGARSIHVALMGDPTLRQHVIAPPTQATIVDQWPQVHVTWTASTDPVAGYHVYRAPSALGPFTRLNTAPIAGTVFTDPSPIVGEITYLVRALRLETTSGGSYWNLSQGAFATATLPGQAANHTEYGVGCYPISDSFRTWFATPAAASAALSGQSLTLTPNGSGYTLSQGGGTWTAPTGAATTLTLLDDDQVAVALSQAMPSPGGSTATLHVHSNGIVGAAPLAMTPAASAVPTVAALLGEASTAWYCWHDFDPTEPGSGPIQVEELAGTVYVTWNGVESRPAGLVNPGSQQLQFELATGVVRYVWLALAIAGTGQTQAPAEQHLIGFSPGGPSVDAGDLDLTTGLPFTLGNQNVAAVHLSATPAPIVTPGAGVTLTYAIDNVPELSPGSRVAFAIFSLTQDAAGTSLAPLQMPGCSRYLGPLDLFVLTTGASPTLLASLVIPPGIAPGGTLFAQAIALFPPGSLPNGQNPFGAISSNGVATFVNDH
ncbi:MAG: hypothetical protein IPK26_27030 [Planctomycetes bacterium]|nr:hypothetical protein [Planctomycetota bacterium]